METSNDIRAFLTSRRERLRPAQAGLPDFGGQRRVKGLRREEVALLAGMSVEYYIRFERGNATGISEGIVDGVSRALHLDEAERTHLHDLVRAANADLKLTRPVRPPASATATPALSHLLDAMTGIPAIVQNAHLDVVASNVMGRALFRRMFESEVPANFARFLFLDERSHSVYRDWEKSAEELVALIRIEQGRSPHDPRLNGLVSELESHSRAFSRMWASRNVREHDAGIKRLHHEQAGDLELHYQGFDVSDSPGLQLVAFTAEAGSPSEDALRLLETLATTDAPVRPI